MYRVTVTIFAVPLVVLGVGTVEAGGPLPNPVKSCEDVRAYIDADNSMTMDTYKKLLIASGENPAGSEDQSLDTTCQLTAAANGVNFTQRVLIKSDGTKVILGSWVIVDGGVCKLTKVSLTGC